jgi:hypothetical protein
MVNTMKAQTLFLVLLIVLLFAGILRGSIFFGVELNPMLFKGEITPGTGTPQSMNMIYSIGGGVIFRSVRIGMVYHSTKFPKAFAVDFDDQTGETFDIKVQGMGLSIGYVRDPFFVSLMVSPASFTILSPTELHVSPHFEVRTEGEWGYVIPLTAGYTWRIFYLGGYIHYIDWSSGTDFDKYESPLPYHWYLADSRHEECTISGLGYGFSLGIKLEI